MNPAAHDDQQVQILNLSNVEIDTEDEKNRHLRYLDDLKNSLIQWRDAIDLPTTFNDYADSILRDLISSNDEDLSKAQFSKKKMRQLYRAFYVHGFIATLRYSNSDDLQNFLFSTKSHLVTGPVEFALTCHVQHFLGKIRCLWLGLLILRSRE